MLFRSWPEVSESFEQRLLRRLMRAGEELGIELGLQLGGGSRPGALALVIDEVQAAAGELLRWNDPQHMYLHCLCEAP